MSFSSIGICKGSRAENTAMLLTKQQNIVPNLTGKSKYHPDKILNPLKKTDPGYGCPQEGTRTEARGIKAQFHVHKEILELCEILYMYGLDDGASSIVGILLRAKKYGLVDFEPEILFQGQNDNTPIYLKRSMEDIYEEFNKNKKFSD
ncbi:unnamed protein product [Lepeophtheirus salmonis]|uniref:(salmon louse) hypothetical protein n=1 Tax=Lepeophtheirus salmonis TaxID=72036 RepID=A0A7R8CH37_LEPSM|nr:unnamed protein product [Lepeophtheirus salmonis]CAF2776314.1 unnamed protein product [Lepeophtheirus salmonis]